MLISVVFLLFSLFARTINLDTALKHKPIQKLVTKDIFFINIKKSSMPSDRTMRRECIYSFLIFILR